MGVTIHFEGQLRGNPAYERVMTEARRYADSLGWNIEDIPEGEAVLKRVRNEQKWDYVGPVKGIVVQPPGDCEPIRLEFDRDLYIQEYVKTQFADPQVHVQVVNLLGILEPEFEHLYVDDEGEFWLTQDRAILLKHFHYVFKAMREKMSSDPRLRGPVRLPSGRIVDLMT